MTTTIRYTTIKGEVIAEKRNGIRSLYVPDPLGSTRALVNNSQVQTDTFSYWPYGEEQTRTGTNPTPFRYGGTKGYYRDSSIKTYARARHLDTSKGRWLTRDPVGLIGGDNNFYRYVGNRPITLIDPSGLFNPACIACGLCAVGAIGAVVACSGDPQGFGHCMKCWCQKHPTICAILIGACAVSCFVCFPALGPIFGRVAPTVGLASASPAFASNGSSGNGQDDCDDNDNDDENKRRAECQAICHNKCKHLLRNQPYYIYERCMFDCERKECPDLAPFPCP